MPDKLIYFADPMCSWCWGFAPVTAKLRERYVETLPLRLILGGLAPGTTKVLDRNGKETIREHWTHVAELTGQPFDFAFFEREGFVYDTEPACRAVVALRRLKPDRAIAFLDRLHQGFYAENKDVTDAETLAALAEDFGVKRDRFRTTFEAEETRQETLEDFQTTRNTGIDGYPTLLAGSREAGFSFISFGYQPAEKIEAMIESWRSHRPGPAIPPEEAT